MPPSTTADLTRRLKQTAQSLGFALAGVCPAITPHGWHGFLRWLEAGYAGQMHYLARRQEAYRHPRHVLDGCRSLLMLAIGYPGQPLCAPEPGQGRVARYAWGVDYHDLIQRRLNELQAWLGQQAPQARVRGVVDTAPLLEREFAQLAGLGWIGKNTLLLNAGLGSWFFLAALLTDLELEYDESFAGEHCGTCRACLDACPTGALVEPYQLDSRRCLSYLTIELREPIEPALRGALGDWMFGCDICQEVCPWNQKSAESIEPAWRRSFPVEAAADRQSVDKPVGNLLRQAVDTADAADCAIADGCVPLVPLLYLDDAAFRRRFRATPLWRPRRRGLLRNAALVLGNQRYVPAVPALIHALGDAEPLVRGAAAWALRQIDTPPCRAARQARRAIELEAEVLAELAVERA